MQMSSTAWSSVQSAYGKEYLAGGATAAANDKLINEYAFADPTETGGVDLKSMCFDAYVNIMFGAAYMNIAAGQIEGNLKGVKSKANPTVTLKVDTKDPAKALLAYNYGGGGVARLVKRANDAEEETPTDPEVFTKDVYLRPDVETNFPKLTIAEQVEKKMTEVQSYVKETKIYQELFDKVAEEKEQKGKGGTGTTTTGGTGTTTTGGTGTTTTGGTGTTTKVGTGTTTTGGTGTTTKVGTGTTTKVGTGTTGETGLRYRLQVASHQTDPDIVMTPLKKNNPPNMNFYSRKESGVYKIFVGDDKGYEKKEDASAFTKSGTFKDPWVVTYKDGVRQTPPPSTTK